MSGSNQPYRNNQQQNVIFHQPMMQPQQQQQQQQQQQNFANPVMNFSNVYRTPPLVDHSPITLQGVYYTPYNHPTTPTQFVHYPQQFKNVPPITPTQQMTTNIFQTPIHHTNELSPLSVILQSPPMDQLNTDEYMYRQLQMQLQMSDMSFPYTPGLHLQLQQHFIHKDSSQDQIPYDLEDILNGDPILDGLVDYESHEKLTDDELLSFVNMELSEQKTLQPPIGLGIVPNKNYKKGRPKLQKHISMQQLGTKKSKQQTLRKAKSSVSLQQQKPYSPSNKRKIGRRLSFDECSSTLVFNNKSIPQKDLTRMASDLSSSITKPNANNKKVFSFVFETNGAKKKQKSKASPSSSSTVTSNSSSPNDDLKMFPTPGSSTNLFSADLDVINESL